MDALNPSSARRIDTLLDHYAQSHCHPTNERIHFVAIPLIMLSLIGLMFDVHPLIAYVFVFASLVYYLRLSLVCTIVMTACSVLTLALVIAMGAQRLTWCVALFTAAWVMQFIGHKIEGKKPSFFEDIQYLWIGPLFVLQPLLRKFKMHW